MKQNKVRTLGVLFLLLSVGMVYAAGTSQMWKAEAFPSVEAAESEEETVMAIPGILDIKKWNYNDDGHSKFGYESDDKGVGYVKNKAVANCDVNCTEAGVYNMEWRWSRNNGGTVHIVVKDILSDAIEVEQDWIVENGTSNIVLEGLITEGKKTITLSMTADHDSWIGNYFSPVMTKINDKFAAVKGIGVDGASTTELDGYDWAFNLPLEYSEENVILNVEYTGGTVKLMNGDTEINGDGGKFILPAPKANEEAVLRLSITPDDGAYCKQTDYTIRLFHIGGIVMDGLTVGGIEVADEYIGALNSEAAAASIEGYTFTSQPVVAASFVDGTTVEGILQEDNGTSLVYSVTAQAGDLIKRYTISVDGVHLLSSSDTDKEAVIKYDGTYVSGDSWDNGKFTVNSADGWGNAQFKFKGNSTITVSVPADMKVKQLRLTQLSDNYSAGKIKTVTTEASAVYLPTINTFTKDYKYDLLVNIEDHKAGSPISIEVEGGSQPVMWFEFVYEDVNPAASIELKSMTRTPYTETCEQTHYVVSFSFDRPVSDAEAILYKTTTSQREQVETLKAEGGSSVVRFALWNLEYENNYELVLAEGSVADSYGNKNAEEITYRLNIGDKPVAEPFNADRFIVVSDVAELREAVATLSGTNGKSDSERTIIYVQNGDYDLGDEVNSGATDVCLGVNKVYNVSIIGESQEGVVIHGIRTGISNPIFSTRYSTNIYMENLTLRNDFDFGKVRAGVAVAHYGGNLDIMKNVTLQSQQDTQVTGERGYYSNCTIHGAVDYVCGGGSHVYDACTFVQTTAGAITAPSTSASLKYGYVFLGCTITGTDGYTLGRPWQNEPRCAWLNTKMLAGCADDGWAGMSNLPTHFYEYNSVDADGNSIDLSVRKNSSSSTNSYTPVLTGDEASHYNIREVLGSTDSWLPTEQTAECDAPVISCVNGELTWAAVEEATGYIVFADNKYKAMVTGTNCVVDADGIGSRYCVVAFNRYGSLGKPSNTVSGNATGINSVSTAEDDKNASVFNLAGLRTSRDTKGILIVNGRKITNK